MNSIHFALICLIHGEDGFKTVTLKKGADAHTLKNLYLHNLNRTLDILNFCNNNNIRSYRVSSALFPLMDHPDYLNMADDILHSNEINSVMSEIAQKSLDNGISLTTHPDQFCLLSSLREEVNTASLAYLERQAVLAQKMNIQAINIHGGSKTNGEEEHYRIFHDVLAQASPHVRSLLTLENDEKSYGLENILEWCEKEHVSCTYDAHHERCFQYRYGYTTQQADNNINPLFSRIAKTWDKKSIIVTHISSPRGGWKTDSFREMCSHHDMIAKEDIPVDWWNYLNTIPDKKCIIDVEAKHKQKALFALQTMV